MAKKPQDEMYDLFSQPLDEPLAPAAKVLKIPSEEMVRDYVKRTSKSTRQCYFWALADLNK